MEDDKRKKLEKVKGKSLKHIRDILPIIKSLEKELSELREEYKDHKERYRVADYQLAELDKRVKVIPTGKRKVAVKSKQLTVSQIKKVANKLGIKL